MTTIELIRKYIEFRQLKISRSYVYTLRKGTLYTYTCVPILNIACLICDYYKYTIYYNTNLCSTVIGVLDKVMINHCLDTCIMQCKLIEFDNQVFLLSCDVFTKTKYMELEASFLEQGRRSMEIQLYMNIELPIYYYGVDYFNGSIRASINGTPYSLSPYINAIRSCKSGHLSENVFLFFKAIGDILCFEGRYLEGNTIFGGGGIMNADFNLIEHSSRDIHSDLLLNKPYYIYACHEAAVCETYNYWVKYLDYDKDLDSCSEVYVTKLELKK